MASPMLHGIFSLPRKKEVQSTLPDHLCQDRHSHQLADADMLNQIRLPPLPKFTSPSTRQLDSISQPRSVTRKSRSVNLRDHYHAHDSKYTRASRSHLMLGLTKAFQNQDDLPQIRQMRASSFLPNKGLIGIRERASHVPTHMLMRKRRSGNLHSKYLAF